jgi:hypothetical protein
MANAGKLTMGGEYGGVIREAKKAAKAHEKISDAAGKTGKNMSQVKRGTQQADGSAKRLAKNFGATLLKVDLIQQALSTAAQATREIVNAARGASRSQRERRLDLRESLVTLGIGQQERIQRAVEQTPGPATQQQRAALVESLVPIAQQGRRFSSQEVQQLVEAFARGGELVFGRGGQALIRNIQPGITVPQAIARTQRQRPTARQALDTFEARAQTEIATRSARIETMQARTGTSAEIGALRFEERRLRRGAMGNMVAGFDTVTGGLVSEAGAAALSRNAQVGVNEQAIHDLTRALQANTRTMQRAAVGAQGEASP